MRFIGASIQLRHTKPGRFQAELVAVNVESRLALYVLIKVISAPEHIFRADFERCERERHLHNALLSGPPAAPLRHVASGKWKTEIEM